MMEDPPAVIHNLLGATPAAACACSNSRRRGFVPPGAHAGTSPAAIRQPKTPCLSENRTSHGLAKRSSLPSAGKAVPCVHSGSPSVGRWQALKAFRFWIFCPKGVLSDQSTCEYLCRRRLPFRATAARDGSSHGRSFSDGLGRRATWEKPVHDVLASEFSIGRRPVTFAGFRAFHPAHPNPPHVPQDVHVCAQPVTGCEWE